jgi:hypothetical protein
LADGDHTFAIEEVSVNFQQVLTPEPAMFSVLGGCLVALFAWRTKYRKA